MLWTLTAGADLMSGQLVNADCKFRSKMHTALSMSKSVRGFLCQATQFNWAHLALHRLSWPAAHRLVARLLANQRLPWVRGHAVVQGPVGSGRHSVARLAASFAGGVVVDASPPGIRTPTPTDVFSRVRDAVLLCLTENKRVILLVDADKVPHASMHPVVHLVASDDLPPGLMPPLASHMLSAASSGGPLQEVRDVLTMAHDDSGRGQHGGRVSKDESEADLPHHGIEGHLESPLMMAKLSRAIGRAVQEHLRVVFVVGPGGASQLLAQAPALSSHCVLHALEPDQEAFLGESVSSRVAAAKKLETDVGLASLVHMHGMEAEAQAIDDQFEQLAKGCDPESVTKAAAHIHETTVKFYEEFARKIPLMQHVSASHFMNMLGEGSAAVQCLVSVQVVVLGIRPLAARISL